MKVLIVGGGGREHALAWKVAQSNRVSATFVAPGNPGTELENKVSNVAIAADDLSGLLKFAKTEQIDLTIIGPEVPLVEGIVDLFQDNGLACFGPSKLAAQLEGSKAFTKAFLERHNIPTGGYHSITTVEQAEAVIDDYGLPVVIKADGLAAGKGVIIAQTRDEAMAAVSEMLLEDKFGDAGKRVVIEEFLVGEEASFIVLVDGMHIKPLATSQDHKARDDNDLGPNTGGMGAYSPAPVVTDQLFQTIMETIIEPTVQGLESDGMPYTGFLYAGIMVTKDGPKVLEYNCRMGDPETQPIMLRLKSDLVDLCEAATTGKLDQLDIDWDPRPSLGVVLAAGGYPDNYRKGDPIAGLPETEIDGQKVFHAGTQLKDGKVLTNGGRVLCACALGDTITQAQSNAYQLVKQISWKDVYYRTDIGYRAVNRG